MYNPTWWRTKIIFVIPKKGHINPTKVVLKTPLYHKGKEYHQWYPDLYDETLSTLELPIFNGKDRLQLCQLEEESDTE